MTRADEIRDMWEHGYTIFEIQRYFGCSFRAIVRALYRGGARDLVPFFTHEAQIERREKEAA